MKKKSILKVSLITIGIIILIPCLFIGGVLGYRWAQDYIFYPRTIQDIIDKYDDMDEEKAFERGYSKIENLNNGNMVIRYSKPVYRKYKDSITAKNRILIKFKEGVDEDYLNQFASKYKAEIIRYWQYSNMFGIELKKKYTLSELDDLINDISLNPNVLEAYPEYSSEPSLISPPA